MNRLHYIIGLVGGVLFLPLLLFRGRHIRSSMISLPEPEDLSGRYGEGHTRIRLLGLGESSISGVGSESNAQALVGQVAHSLAKKLGEGVEWQVLAKTGYQVEDLIARLLPKLGATPDLILIGLGANDAFKLNNPWRWNRQLTELLDKIRSKHPSPPIVFINMPPAHEFPLFTPLLRFFAGHLVKILGKEIPKVIVHYKDIYYCNHEISVSRWMEESKERLSPEDFFSDGVHPSMLTCRLWGGEVAEFIVSKQIINRQPTCC